MKKDKVWLVNYNSSTGDMYLDDFGEWVKNIDFAREFSRNNASIIARALCNVNNDNKFKVVGIGTIEGVK